MSGDQTWTPNGGLYRLAKISPYKGSTLLGPTSRSFRMANFRYSDPTRYLISSILPLPLPKGKGGSPGHLEWQPQLSDRTHHPSFLNQIPLRNHPLFAKKMTGPDPWEYSKLDQNLTKLALTRRYTTQKGEGGESRTGPRSRTKGTTQSRILQKHQKRF